VPVRPQGTGSRSRRPGGHHPATAGFSASLARYPATLSAAGAGTNPAAPLPCG